MGRCPRSISTVGCSTGDEVGCALQITLRNWGAPKSWLDIGVFFEGTLGSKRKLKATLPSFLGAVSLEAQNPPQDSFSPSSNQSSLDLVHLPLLQYSDFCTRLEPTLAHPTWPTDLVPAHQSNKFSGASFSWHPWGCLKGGSKGTPPIVPTFRLVPNPLRQI